MVMQLTLFFFRGCTLSNHFRKLLVARLYIIRVPIIIVMTLFVACLDVGQYHMKFFYKQ